MIPGNPWALIKGDLIVDLFYAHNFDEEHNNARLSEYDYDYYIVCDEIGQELCVGDFIDEKGRPKARAPYPSWTWNLDIGEWEAPVPKPKDTTRFWSWEEETRSWVECGIASSQTYSTATKLQCCGGTSNSVISEKVI